VATSLAEIEGFLRNENLRFTTVEEYIRTSFATDDYVDAENDKSVFIVIKPEETGEYFKIMAPNLYRYPRGPHAEALFRTLLMISWRTKLIQFEFDDNDGEVRGIVEFPLEDSGLTQRQLMRCLNGMVQIIDEYHQVIRGAIESGVVDFARIEKRDEIERRSGEIFDYIGMKPEHSRSKANRLELDD
jgi:hypothetical protein